MIMSMQISLVEKGNHVGGNKAYILKIFEANQHELYLQFRILEYILCLLVSVFCIILNCHLF